MQARTLRTLTLMKRDNRLLFFYNANHSTAESGSEVGMQTLEKNISDNARSQAENVVATTETRVLEAILSAMDILVVPKMELAMKSVGFASTRNPICPDQLHSLFELPSPCRGGPLGQR